MTFNIRHGLGLDSEINLGRIAAEIKNANVDICALNEVDKCFSRRSNFIDQGKWLAEKLHMNYEFGPAISVRWGKPREYGNVLLTRYPILKNDNHIFRLPFAEPRSILDVIINVAGAPIRVLCSHFSLHPKLHQKQVNFCFETEETFPLIIMGDFNQNPTSNGYNKLTQKYTDCCMNQPLPTFPAQNPRSRLDYIFVSKHFDILEHSVRKTIASDHLPVTAKIALTKATNPLS
jgi:endonuclease/exonuclease/phosphatase family metal-dependent hydrolase